MEELTGLVTKWEQTLQKVKGNNGTASPIEIGEKATEQEIQAKEKELGYPLPPSYIDALQNIGKSLSFYYAFSEETIIPIEFDEIFSGEIHWHIDYLQSLDELADQLKDDDEDYASTLRGKVEFSHAANGDLYAFDMLVEGKEKPVVYWNHEDGTITFIANSFRDYLEKITELHCIGSEIWQLFPFLDKTGLDPTSPEAIEWRKWFNSFSETTLDDVKDDLDQLIAYVLHQKKLDAEVIPYFSSTDKKKLFEKLKEELDHAKSLDEQKIIAEIIGKVLGAYAEPWVTSLWEEEPCSVDVTVRSILTSYCLDRKQALQLVFNSLENSSTKKINGYKALAHLQNFHSKDVIVWMEKHVTFPVTEGWDTLFLKSNLSWHEIERWSGLEEKHQTVVIHSLENYVHTKLLHPNDPHVLVELPPKQEFISFLINLRDKQVLKKRISAVEKVIENVHVFY
ncbi:SMI1/KNR4 family protein [Bacillus alkalicellulosilyticus]|uniref:SMI1/KNR4 family protein n=1 Tax=Alkalihalobacterium alkalicellulosilyticum TaxID=1912214 RepID=UPI000997957D|nr:SMI1/KNR4 family protein [Bacillus alkalicellulosilyticus]